MERHSVPQNIMDVEFKLFGSFTIKQFAYLAAGFIGALVVFVSPFPDLLKMILLPMSMILGIFLGVIKINGQPSSVFLSNFIAALFSSQTRIWQKSSKTPEMLQEARAAINPKDVEVLQVATKTLNRSSKLMPLQSLVIEEENELDKEESDRLEQIEKHFNFAVGDLEKETMRAEIETKKVSPPKLPSPPDTAIEQPPIFHIDPEADNLAGSIAHKELQGEPILRTNKYAAIYKQMQSQTNRPIVEEPSQPKAEEILQEQLPEQVQGQVQEQVKEQEVVADSVTNADAQVQAEPSVSVETENKVENKEATVTQVQTNIPSPPLIPQHRKPNIVAGIVVDKNDKPIAHATIEFKDEKEKLLRKVTTTVNGTFGLSTPLPNGTYRVDINAEGFKFNRFELILSGTALPNYKFKAK